MERTHAEDPYPDDFRWLPDGDDEYDLTHEDDLLEGHIWMYWDDFGRPDGWDEMTYHLYDYDEEFGMRTHHLSRQVESYTNPLKK